MSKIIYVLPFVTFCALFASDAERIALLGRAIIISDKQLKELHTLAAPHKKSNINYVMSKNEHAWPLYRRFPGLKKQFPRVALCQSTPVARLNHLSSKLGIDCYIKRDDCLAKEFSGNKLRKAELIFADVVAHKDYCDVVMAFGCIGSNLTVVIAACAQKLGLKCILMLKPEPNSAIVRRNLLLMQHYGAEIHFYANEEKRAQAAYQVFKDYKLQKGSFPYVVPTGGALPLGVVGYVNAAFELQEQIAAGAIKKPDLIYIATGGTFSAGVSCGTTAGLVLGLKALGLAVKVVAVCCQPENAVEYRAALVRLIQETNTLLHNADATFPLVKIHENDIDIVCDCAGTKYGLFTQQGMNAVHLVKDLEGITLDGTYTGKAFSALLADATVGKLQGKRVLFWNTFCGSDFGQTLKYQDYKKLPTQLHTYFQGSTQPLDS